MYVLIVSRGYPTDKDYINGVFEFDQALALSKNGLKIVLIVLDLRSIRHIRKYGFYNDSRNGIEIEVASFPIGMLSRKIYFIFGKKVLQVLFEKTLKKYGNPDVIHSHFVNIGYLCAKALKKYDIPIVHTEHSSLIHTTNISKQTWKLADYTYQKSNLLITVSESLKQSIVQNFHKKSTVINNIVDTELFYYRPDIVKFDFFTFISVGSLTKNKRMDLLISSFAKSNLYKMNCRLIIIGDGPEKRSLQKQISLLSMESYIDLLGAKSRLEVGGLLAKSNCFILLSVSETFGVSFIEAHASGLPVISTKSGGPEFFINSSNGIIVESDNANDISDTMRYIHENVNSYNPSNISSRSKAMFSSGKISSKLLLAYNKLLVERKKADE
ncbi:MAG: glycosyltransferase [Tenericutes bacterium]|nr:glycosyltransferase [Mycoplasmatota bacterium]